MISEEEKLQMKKECWFRMGNVFVDEHIKNIGQGSALVYLCIKRYADSGTRIATISPQIIASNLRISPEAVLEEIKKLQNYKFINKQAGRDTYYLTHSKDWLTESSSERKTEREHLNIPTNLALSL